MQPGPQPGIGLTPSLAPGPGLAPQPDPSLAPAWPPAPPLSCTPAPRRRAAPRRRPPAHPPPTRAYLRSPAPHPVAQSILGLTEGEASRLREDVEEKKVLAAP